MAFVFAFIFNRKLWLYLLTEVESSKIIIGDPYIWSFVPPPVSTPSMRGCVGVL